MSRRRAFQLLLVVPVFTFALIVGGCSRPVPARIAAVPTPPGRYEAGQRVLLANGMSLQVPKGWRLDMMRRGALVTAPPEGTGIVGGAMTQEKGPAVIFSVYGKSDDFRRQVGSWESVWRQRDHVRKDLGISKERIEVSDEVSATAFVITYRSKPLRHQVYYGIERQKVQPVVIGSNMTTLPPGVSGKTDADLARSLLDYLAFRAD